MPRGVTWAAVSFHPPLCRQEPTWSGKVVRSSRRWGLWSRLPTVRILPIHVQGCVESVFGSGGSEQSQTQDAQLSIRLLPPVSHNRGPRQAKTEGFINIVSLSPPSTGHHYSTAQEHTIAMAIELHTGRPSRGSLRRRRLLRHICMR